MANSFIENTNKIANELDTLININANMENISLTPTEVTDVQEVKNNLSVLSSINSSLNSLLNLNANIENISLSSSELSSIIEVKNQLATILLVPQKEESVSSKYTEILTKAQTILDQYNSVLETKQMIDTEHDEITQKHSEVVTLASDVTLKSNEVKNLSVQMQLLDETEDASANYNSATGVLVLGVPRGLTGKQGDAFRINAYGTEDTKSMYDDAVASTSFFALDSTKLYFKISDESADWSQGIAFGKGATGDSLTIDSIDNNGDGTFVWHFSDGTDYITPSLKGDTGATGLAPEHEKLSDTSIRFKNPDGTWGDVIGLIDVYTKSNLDEGQLDNRYYTESEIDAKVRMSQVLNTTNSI